TWPRNTRNGSSAGCPRWSHESRRSCTRNCPARAGPRWARYASSRLPDGLQEAEVGGAADGGLAGVDVQLGEDVLGVGAQRIDRHEQLTGDLRPGEFGREQPEDLELAVAQALVAGGGRGGRHRGGLVALCRAQHEGGVLSGGGGVGGISGLRPALG